MQTLQSILLATHTTDAIELLKNLISIPSISREENRTADTIEAFL
jgi:acetylornithine deacetylase/succinyl-diaminopimelate desuccinylase-like protein